MPDELFSLVGRSISDRPDCPLSERVGKVMPPAGPKPADFMPESICGEDVECFKARLCANPIGGIAGDGGISIVDDRMLSPWPSVFKLSWLGFRFIAGICGLMNDGEEGSETRLVESEVANGGCMERPFMLRLLGEGEVIGLWKWLLMAFGSLTVRVFIVDESPPKEVPGKLFNGIRLIGESGEEDGDGSESEDVSVVKVVVGDESAEFCVDVLSL